MRVLLVALLIAAAACAAAGAEVPPSLEPPGGLSRSEVPQFVLLSHDDAIKESTYQLLRNITGGQVASGCPIVATMFAHVKRGATDCELTMDLFESGFEIADHTTTHPALGNLTKPEVAQEIAGFKTEIAKCGVPESAVVGFRAPFFEQTPEVRQVLHEQGFLYDSTLLEDTQGDSLSRSMGERVWPFTMGNGTWLASCQLFDHRQSCAEGESYPGLWQVPVWQLSALGGPYNLDPGEDFEHATFDVVTANFDAAYNGNRAPLGIAFHTPFLQAHPTFVDGLRRFVEAASAKQDVYFVTYRQLLAWMQNPVPASQLTPELLGCGNAGGAPGTLADEGAPAAAAS